jgi:transketolase
LIPRHFNVLGKKMQNPAAEPHRNNVEGAWSGTRDEGFLRKKALEARKHIVRMTGAAGSGHPGGSLSAIDMLVALYFSEMTHFPGDPQRPERDRFILSKGHGCPALYAVLGMTGYFPEDELIRLRKLGSILPGHPCMLKTPGVEMSTGSLGQGLSAANGMALAQRLDQIDYRVFVMMGDGELQEGQVWEAAMTAAHYTLDKVVGIIDYNGLQIDGTVSDVMEIAPLAEKWKAFGWEVLEIDGHKMDEILGALDRAREVTGKPVMIVTRTVKGKGVSFMEHNLKFHGNAPTADQVTAAIEELERAEEALKSERPDLYQAGDSQ